jgi:hypothetical protein
MTRARRKSFLLLMRVVHAGDCRAHQIRNAMKANPAIAASSPHGQVTHPNTNTSEPLSHRLAPATAGSIDRTAAMPKNASNCYYIFWH